MVPLHKRFMDEQVKELIEKYLRKEITRSYLQEILGIGKTRFFALVKAYHRDFLSFSIRYRRKKKTRSISKDIAKKGDRFIFCVIPFRQNMINKVPWSYACCPWHI